MDLEDLVAFINDKQSAPKGKTGKKGKAQTKKEENLPSEIVKTFDAVNLNKDEANTNNLPVDEINIDTVKTFDPNENMQEAKPKKKKKRHNKGTKDETKETEEQKNEKAEKENKYKKFFDFSGVELTNSRFQDNSIYRVLKNWEDKPWNQT